MKPKKITNADGSVRWLVHFRPKGRGSSQVKKRFEKRIDADNFILELRSGKLGGATDTTAAVATGIPGTTFRIEAENWLSQQRARFSPGHIKRVTGILAELLPAIGGLRPHELNLAKLSQIQNQLLARRCAKATVNRKLEVVTSVLAFATRHERISRHPGLGLRKLDEARESMKFWEKKEAISFLTFAAKRYPPESPDRWVYLVYYLALNTGLRAGEIWGLEVGDIVHDGQAIHVKRQFDRLEKKIRLPKSKRARLVPCNPELLCELKNHIAAYELQPRDLIFRGAEGGAVCHDAFRRRRFEMDLRRSAVPPIRFHDLRHTAATLMIDQGVPLPTVKAVLGHQNINTTMNYVHLLGSSIRDVSALFSITPKREIENHALKSIGFG